MTVIYLTTASTSPWTVPSDWNSSNNTIEVIGGGGGGSPSAGGNDGAGAGGGAYSKISNLTLTPGGTAAFQVGGGGAASTTGGDTWFNGATLAASSVGAKAGTGASGITAGTGGASASGVGTTKSSGGNGGTQPNAQNSGSGGGGAAGPNGIGAAGGAGPSSIAQQGGSGGGGSGGGSVGAVAVANTSGNGGAGGNNSASAGSGAAGTGNGGAGGDGSAGGGGGGAAAIPSSTGTTGGKGGAGGAGTEWDASHGAGGGGGGGGWGGSNATSNGGAGGNGGLYGGGGGGGGFGSTAGGSGGTGAAGIIVITYTPSSTSQKVVALDSTATSPWALPLDWPGHADAIYVIGAGGNGSGRVSTTRGGSGGGGGACVFATNYTMSTAPTFSIGAAGSAANTTFDSSAFVAAHGTTGTTTTAGAGGTTASSTVPTGGTKFAGGAGVLPPTSSAYGGGGGGAAGLNGAGGSASTDIGGTGDNGTTAAPAVGTNGTAGTEWTATAGGTFGSGSGGSGFASGTHTGTAGGQYGGGASGASDGSNASAGGQGGGGLVVILYTPVTLTAQVAGWSAALESLSYQQSNAAYQNEFLSGYKLGFLPPGITAHFGLGVYSESTGTGDLAYMTGSGIPWDYRYIYEPYPTDNSIGIYTSDCITNSYTPVITYYTGVSGQGMTTATVMNSYYTYFVAALSSMKNWGLWKVTYNGNVTVSVDCTTATYGGTGGSDCIVLAGNFHSSGKWVVRFHVVANGSTHLGFGISHNWLATPYVGGASDTFGVFPGGVQLNGSVISSVAVTGAAGNDIDLAVDFDNKLFWIRETGGNWNGNATFIPGDANGVSFSGITGGLWAPAISEWANGDQVTFGTPPTVTGFMAWNSSPSRPAMIMHMEPDLWGYFQSGFLGGAQTDDPRTVPISVASSGYAGLGTLPNTAAGFAQALKLLRDTTAPGIYLAYHCSTWGPQDGFTATRPQYSSYSESPAATGTRIANFYNLLGTPFDLIFHDTTTCDRDSEYALTTGADGGSGIPLTAAGWWWQSGAFDNWRQLIAAFYSTAFPKAPGFLWQIPIGNTLFQSCNDTSYHFQDNKVEYFLTAGASVAQGSIYNPNGISNYINAGIVAILFGPGQLGQTFNSTDWYNYAGDGITNPGAITNHNGWSGNTNTATVADDDGGFLRLAAANYYTSPITLPSGNDLGINKQLAFEWLLVTGTPIAQDDNLLLEWASFQQGNLILPSEVAVHQSGDNILPDEWVSTQRQQDSIVPFEWVCGRAVSAGNLLEWISSQRTDKGSLFEWLSSVPKRDASILYEIAAAQISNGNYPSEWLGTIITSQTQSDNLPFEWTCSQIANSTRLSEWVSSQLAQTNLPLGFTSSVVREDNVVLSEFVSSQSLSKSHPFEWICTQIANYINQLECVSSQSMVSSGDFELVSSILREDTATLSEWLSRQIANGNIPVEWLGTIITSQTENNNFPFEWISFQAEGISNLIGWLSSQRTNINNPFEWLAALRQQGALLPSELLSAQYIDSSIFGEWLSANRSINLYALSEILSNGKIDYSLNNESLFSNILNYNILQEVTTRQQLNNALLAEWAGAVGVTSNINVLLEMMSSSKIDISLLSSYISSARSDNIFSLESLYSSANNYNLLTEIIRNQSSDFTLPDYWLGAIGVTENVNLFLEWISILASSNPLPLGYDSSVYSGIITPSESLIRSINDAIVLLGYSAAASRDSSLRSDIISSGTSGASLQKEWLLGGAANFKSPKEFLSVVLVDKTIPIEWQLFIGAHLRSDQALLFELLAANAIYVVSYDNLPFEWSALPKPGPGQIILGRPSGPLRADPDNVLSTGGPRIIVVPGDLLPKKG